MHRVMYASDRLQPRPAGPVQFILERLHSPVDVRRRGPTRGEKGKSLVTISVSGFLDPLDLRTSRFDSGGI